MIELTDEMRAEVDNALANRTPCVVGDLLGTRRAEQEVTYLDRWGSG